MIKLPETEEEMIAIINEWIEDVEGHDSADRCEMLHHAFDVWSILDFMENKQ
mgnify:FL=1